MGSHNPVSSLQMICCSSGEWFHKQCLKEQAHQLADDFACPKCSDVDAFRENVLMNGIFIPNNNVIALYTSAIENDDEENQPPQKKRRIHKEWIHETTFKSKKEADDFLIRENWAYQYRNKSENGIRITFRCKHVKFRGEQCAAGVALLFDSRNEDIHLYRALTEHTHQNHSNAVSELPADVKQAIRELYENSVTKPKSIVTNLVHKKFDVPPSSLLKTFLKKLNEEKYGKEKLNCGTLEKWLAECSPVPDSDTQPFVLNYEMNYEDEEKIDFRFVVSTKLLLNQAIGCEKLHVDATYKIIWQGFPVLVVGTTDMHRAFHPIGVAVCTNEQERDFEFIFASVKDKIRSIFDSNFDPEYVIADAAAQIRNAGKKVFGIDIKIIMCWFHMHKNVSDKVPTFLKELSKQSQFMADLEILQVAKTQEIFNKALVLFMNKWREESDGLIDYFDNVWVRQNPNWYEAFAKLTPSTNNAMESNNRLIKDEHTIRERMDLGKFRVVLFSMIETWSNAYVSGHKTIELHGPKIELKMWTEGYNFAKANVKITSRRQGNTIVYRSALSQNNDDSTDWDNFDSFKKNSFSFYDTTFMYPVKRENWLKSECDCADYFKLFFCKHIIGIAIRLKCVVAPAEAKTVPIGQKRKRGRPAKAKPALTRQD